MCEDHLYKESLMELFDRDPDVFDDFMEAEHDREEMMKRLAGKDKW